MTVRLNEYQQFEQAMIELNQALWKAVMPIIKPIAETILRLLIWLDLD